MSMRSGALNRWISVMVPCLLMAVAPSSTPLQAQTKTSWVIPTTIGYGGLGFAAVYLLAEEAAREAERRGEPDYSWGTVPLVALATYLVGGKIGYRIGEDADELLSEGRELTSLRRIGVQLGTVLAGATLGAAVSLIPRSISDQSDTRITATWALSGAAAGAIFQLLWNEHLYPSGLEIEPNLRALPSGRFLFGLTCRY